MDPENEMPRPENEPDPLERLLQAAAWPEPDPDRVARLERRWRELSPARARRKWQSRIAVWLAVAAGLLAAIALGWLLPRPEAEGDRTAPGRQMAVTEQAAPKPVEQPSVSGPPHDDLPANDLPPARPPRLDSFARSRPPTAYEALVFRSITRSRRPADDEPADDGPADDEPADDLLDAALRRRLADADADPDEVAEPLLADRESYERALVWEIQDAGGPRQDAGGPRQDAGGPRQAAAIELLGRVGSRRSVPLLIELSRRADTHSPAVRALARLADPDTLGQLVGLETDAELQQELLAALFARPDRRSVAIYLTFVSARDTGEAALAALDRVASPPVDLLFDFFNAPQQKQRRAAAVVLGRLDDPEIPRRLIGMVAGSVKRPVALVALVASSDQQALRFVALAERDPAWTGPVHAARLQVHAMFP